MAMLRACLGGDRKEASKKKEVVMGTRKSGGQPGNLNVLKHGFYSKHFQNSELEDLDEARDLQEEITMMRVVIRRLLKMARGCKDMGELVTVLEALGLASTRVAGLMRTQKFLGGNKNPFDEMIDKVIDDVTKDWPIRKALERK
jgi:hypothetical protein